jgi:hypothetical protein
VFALFEWKKGERGEEGTGKERGYTNIVVHAVSSAVMVDVAVFNSGMKVKSGPVPRVSWMLSICLASMSLRDPLILMRCAVGFGPLCVGTGRGDGLACGVDMDDDDFPCGVDELSDDSDDEVSICGGNAVDRAGFDIVMNRSEVGQARG